MTGTTRILSYPFKPAVSFFEVGIRTETLQVKEEWKHLVSSPSDRAVEPRKAA